MLTKYQLLLSGLNYYYYYTIILSSSLIPFSTLKKHFIAFLFNPKSATKYLESCFWSLSLITKILKISFVYFEFISLYWPITQKMNLPELKSSLHYISSLLPYKILLWLHSTLIVFFWAYYSSLSTSSISDSPITSEPLSSQSNNRTVIF